MAGVEILDKDTVADTVSGQEEAPPGINDY